MGRITIDLVVANNRDLILAETGTLPANKVRRLAVRGVVDSGSAYLVLPKMLVKQLGLPATGKAKVRYADGRTGKRDTVTNVYLEILGRGALFNAVVEPKRSTALIGAIVLEALDLLVDCTQQRIMPRDPHIIVTEVE